MHKDYILRIDMPNQIDNPLGIGMRRKRYILHLHINLILPIINLQFPGPTEQPIPKGSRDTVPRNNDCILGVTTPFFEDLEGGATVEHAWCSKEDVGEISAD